MLTTQLFMQVWSTALKPYQRSDLMARKSFFHSVQVHTHALSVRHLTRTRYSCELPLGASIPPSISTRLGKCHTINPSKSV